jgi:hypothetical protein
MSTRDELEASLRTRCDRETLAVYADFLQCHGDPRGELIALDLRGDDHAEKRRGQLLRTWLGEDVVVRWDAEQRLWYAGDLGSTYATFDCGFVDLFVTDDLVVDGVLQLLDAAPGKYLRRMSMTGPTALLELVLERFLFKDRPWLQHLAIARPVHETPRLVDERLASRLVAAAPNLEVLDVRGRNMLGQFTHPNLRELGVTGSEAIDLIEGPPLPSLHTIDYAFDDDRDVPPALIAPSRAPALRRFCVSREERSARLFDLLGTLAIAPQLTHFVAPSIRSRAELELVQAGIDRMPLLREIAIARAYAVFPAYAAKLRHPWARVRVPEPWQWRPREAYDRPVSIDGFSLDLAKLVDVLEDQFDDLPADARDVWSRLFTTIETLDTTEWIYEQAFHLEDLTRAVDALVVDGDLEDFGTYLKRNRVKPLGGSFIMIRWA